MDTDNERLIDEQFNKLPKNLQAALEAVPWQNYLKNIALANKLSLKQMSNFERETMLIIYGFENPLNYIDNLIREVDIDESSATSIAEEVSEKIFTSITQKAGVNREADQIPSNTNDETGVISQNLPMIEEGEVAHDVPHVESPITNTQPPIVEKKQETLSSPVSPPPKTPPSTHYPGGLDPYREPLV